MIDCLKITNNNIQRINKSIEEFKLLIYDYNARDLYFIDQTYDISSLTKKRNCVICKLDYFEAIIFYDECYLINNRKITPQIENSIISFLNSNTDICFHLVILDFLFINCIEIINSEFHLFITRNRSDNTNDNIYTNLVNLEYRILELLDIIKNLSEGNSFLEHLKIYKLDNLLNRDIVDSHQTIYLQNNHYIKQFIENSELKLEDIRNDVSKFIRNIDNNQKIDNIKLAKDRNKYALYNLYISFLSLSMSLSTLITSILGMNVKNNIENSLLAFYLINGGIIISIPTIFFIQIVIFNKYGNRMVT